MKITLNNRPEEFNAEKMTVRELLQAKNFTFKLLVIKINKKPVKKDQYDTAEIHDGDEVIVHHMISGG
ncbi:MAG TPA: sulfur carrier protein ThiS [Chloroflexi bacterium]|nr:sulfur carrier protein ThiS [Chloroflexota bacterium]